MSLSRLSRFFFASLLVAGSAWPMSAAAQSDPQVITVDQVRSAFSSAGYAVDQPTTWDWTRPPLTSFEVHGQNDGRVLMVLVYPSMTAADDALLLAQSHEQALNAGQPLSSASGPHIVSGFGTSTWARNVALVQSTETQLDRMYQVQVDRDNGIATDQVMFDDPSAPMIAVDLDFLQALQSSVANL
jgi:hypothetical protein